MMILTYQQSGGSFETSISDPVVVRLEENPTTGYRWTLEKKDNLELERDYFERESSAIGAAGFRVFIFRTPRAGLQELRMKNWREWEGDSSIICRFSANILVI